MRDSVRRAILFLGTVSIGTFFIFVQLPVIYILLVTFVMGVFLLFLTGALSLSDLRLRRGEEHNQKDEPEVPPGPGWREKFEEKMPSFYRGYLKIEAAVAPLGRVADRVKNRLRRPKREAITGDSPVIPPPATEKKRLFGGLRDRIAQMRSGRGGESPSASVTIGSDGKTVKSSPRDEAMAAAGAIASSGVANRSGDGSDDVFGDISLDGLEDEIFAGLDGDIGGDGPLFDPDGIGSEISIDMDSDPGSLMDDAAAILAQEGGLDEDAFEGDELSSGVDLDAIDLDDDLDSLEIDDDLDGIGDINDEPVTSPATPSDSEEEEEEEEKEKEQPSAVIAANEGYQFTPEQSSKVPDFGALGGGSDMDILSALKGDVKTIKKDLDLSLVRDLKNVDVNAKELEDELEMVFKRLGGTRKEESAKESDS